MWVVKDLLQVRELLGLATLTWVGGAADLAEAAAGAEPFVCRNVAQGLRKGAVVNQHTLRGRQVERTSLLLLAMIGVGSQHSTCTQSLAHLGLASGSGGVPH